MPSRQDQLHSYQYSLQRVVAALVTHDPDPQRSPLRRAGMTALVSLLIAALAVGAVAIYGIITGNSRVSPTDPNVVFQEKRTGARFVYLESDDKLHPVLNYTSGLLLAAAPAPELKSISAERLASVPLGAPLGIPAAPDSLPAPGDLLAERWSVCTDNLGDEGDPQTTLLIGDRLTDGTVADQADRALLVRDPNRRTFLIHDNRRFAIPSARAVATLRALGWADQQPWQVSVAWLNAVPLGPDLVPPRLPAGGGELVTDSGQQFAVTLADGSAPVTPMQARLLQTVPGVEAPRALGNDFLRLPPSRTRLSDSADPNGLPSAVPELFGSRPGRACLTLPVDSRSGAGIRIDPTVPTAAAVAGESVAPGANLADLVHVPRGKGAIVVAAASPTAPPGTGTVSLVTDTGLRHPLADRQVLAKLGYAQVKPLQVPSELVEMLPEGPALDPARARQGETP